MNEENIDYQINNVVENGKMFYEQQNFDEAEKIFKKGLEAHPNSELLMYNLALVYFEQKKYSLSWKLASQIKEIDCKDLLKKLKKAPTNKKTISLITGILLVITGITIFRNNFLLIVFSLFIIYGGLKAIFFRLYLVREVSITAMIITFIIIVLTYSNLPPHWTKKIDILILIFGPYLLGFILSVISTILLWKLKDHEIF